MGNGISCFSSNHTLQTDAISSSAKRGCNEVLKRSRRLTSLTESLGRCKRSSLSSANPSNRPPLRHTAFGGLRKNPVPGVESGANSTAAKSPQHKEAGSVGVENQRTSTLRELHRHSSQMLRGESVQQGIYKCFTLKIIGNFRIDSFGIEIIKGMAYLAAGKEIASGEKDIDTVIKELRGQLDPFLPKDIAEQKIDDFLMEGIITSINDLKKTAYLVAGKEIASGEKDLDTAINELREQLGPFLPKDIEEQKIDRILIEGIIT